MKSLLQGPRAKSDFKACFERVPHLKVSQAEGRFADLPRGLWAYGTFESFILLVFP